jgi:2-dehydro-3-deoxy-D-arabinonate dehydratase
VKLSKVHTPVGPRWLCDDAPLAAAFSLNALLGVRAAHVQNCIALYRNSDAFSFGDVLPPLEATHEVWASGVTYLRSRDARKAESSVADVYQKVYDAERPELFMKSVGWRVVTTGSNVRIRNDATWNVPEPELTLMINAFGEIVGYTAGNDMSSRDIEGENPLYLPQAKIYNGSCALGHEIVIASAEEMRELPVRISIIRDGAPVFEGNTNINRMKRTLTDLVTYLYREYAFPCGAFLMTGTGVVPPESFTLAVGDLVHINVGDASLANTVTS